MANEPNNPLKSCFIAMPISDPPGYDAGHFRRVYEHLIRPACTKAGVTPSRADDVKAANYIVLDILQRIIDVDVVICDLSGRNPNVMYEVGFRQAFNLPIVFIKDKRTERVFDIQGFRTVDYDESLRIDCVNRDIDSLRSAIEATIQPDHHDVNSLVKLLGISKAELPKNKEISDDTALVLSSIRDLSERLAAIGQSIDKTIVFDDQIIRRNTRLSHFVLASGEKVQPGDIICKEIGGEIGKLVNMDSNGVIAIRNADGNIIVIAPDDPIYNGLYTIPF